jgi:hypothetical protein
MIGKDTSAEKLLTLFAFSIAREKQIAESEGFKLIGS